MFLDKHRQDFELDQNTGTCRYLSGVEPPPPQAVCGGVTDLGRGVTTQPLGPSRWEEICFLEDSLPLIYTARTRDFIVCVTQCNKWKHLVRGAAVRAAYVPCVGGALECTKDHRPSRDIPSVS